MISTSALFVSFFFAMSLALLAGPTVAADTKQADPGKTEWQNLVRDAMEIAGKKDPNTSQPPALKLKLKNGSNCTLDVGTDRQARCAETGQVFNGLIVYCDSMPPQLRARCEAVQSTGKSKGH